MTLKPYWKWTLAGLVGLLPAIIVLSATFSDPGPGESFPEAMGERALVVAGIYALFGLGFGFAWPERAWRWGVAVSFPALLWLSLLLLLSVPVAATGGAASPGYPLWMDFLPLLAFLAATGGAAVLGAVSGGRIRGRLARRTGASASR